FQVLLCSMEPRIESDCEALLRLLSAVIEYDRIRAGHDDGTLNRIFQAARGDGRTITGYLGCVRITKVPLEPIHPRLDRSELCFLVSNFLVCALFTLRCFFGSIFKMLACLNFASIRRAFCFLLVLFLFFRGEV